MRSPFAIFRKHQATLMVAVVMLAMFGFIVAPAIQDPTNMAPPLIILFVALSFGCVGWVLGIRSKKATEFGFAGLIAGTLISVGAMLVIGEPARVKADTGDISQQEFGFLQFQRAMANQFVGQAYLLARQRTDGQFLQQPPPFGFHPDPVKDIVIGELLRREASELGIVVTDEMVNNYISAVTQGKIGPEDVREIRNTMRLSESDLYNILRSEIQARMAAQYLYSGTALPPEAYWDLYKRLNVRQSVSVVPIPVQAFVDDSAEPSESELQEFFAAHRDNFPNTSDAGRLEEGRPGFRQPRKIRLAYVEIPFEEIENHVEPPTDGEIEAFYNEHYASFPADELGTDDEGTDSAQEESSAADDGSPEAAGGPALPAPEEQPATNQQPLENRIDADDLPPGEEENFPQLEGEEETEPTDAEQGALPSARSDIQFVAVFDDDDDSSEAEPAAAESPDAVDASTVSDNAEDADTDSKPEDGTTIQEGATDADVSEASPEESAGFPAPPPPPVARSRDDTAPTAGEPAVPELDDERRSEIRDQMLRERTNEKMREIVEDVREYFRELEFRIGALKDDPDYLTDDQALETLRDYAQQQGLVYTETPLLSQQELLNSEEYPIGSAVDRLFADPMSREPVSTVAELMFRAEPREVFRSESAVHPETDSRFVFWKIEDQAEFVPESLSEPGIREQVVTAWRELQARDEARARAEELAASAEQAAQPLSETLAGQTVTGTEGANVITVLRPPRFSWLSEANPAMSPNPFNPTPPERTQLRSVPGRTGDSFMKTVFDELREGDTGVAHSIDRDYFYVVRVNERTFSNAEDLQAFRQQFMNEQIFAPYYVSDYPLLAQRRLRDYQSDWSEELFEKHSVEIMEPEEDQAAGEEAPPTQTPGY